jgi:hypothetical protein
VGAFFLNVGHSPQNISIEFVFFWLTFILVHESSILAKADGIKVCCYWELGEHIGNRK